MNRESLTWPDAPTLVWRRITDAFPAPGAWRDPSQPSSSSGPVRGTGRTALYGFGNFRSVSRKSASPGGLGWKPSQLSFKGGTVGDQFVDLVTIAAEARQQRKKAGSLVAPADLRRDAIRALAEREHKAGRFKNLESAERTLHDACTQRLKPDIRSIDDFDQLLEKWLRGNRAALSELLKRHARNDQHRALIRVLIEDSGEER